MLGLIVGSGFEHFELVDVKAKTVETPFGEVELDVGLMENKEVALLHRHGKDHHLAPHQIPLSRSNVGALKELGCKGRLLPWDRLVEWRRKMPPGTLRFLIRLLITPLAGKLVLGVKPYADDAY